MQGCKILVGLMMPLMLAGQSPTVGQYKNLIELNAKGEVVQMGKLFSKTENSINVSILANGLYHISGYTNDGAIFLSEKVVIIK